MTYYWHGLDAVAAAAARLTHLAHADGRGTACGRWGLRTTTLLDAVECPDCRRIAAERGAA